jgi:16S rRNA (adenine1518-N6/adenine1519-N6)-dimethyltransferase
MIALAGDIKKGEIVIEIGPGKGALTEKLLSAGAKVIAIEKDESLVQTLKEKFEKEIKEKKLEIILGDALGKISLPENYKLIANIPYYITGAILEKFLGSENPPTLAVLMLQKEVAERIVARNKKESILSISVKVFGTPKIVMKVSRGNFFPIPNVDSAVLKIENIKNPFTNKKEESGFFELVKKGFAHKRKKLTSNLELSTEQIENFGIPKNARAEDMTLKDWLEISKKLETRTVKNNG